MSTAVSLMVPQPSSWGYGEKPVLSSPRSITPFSPVVRTFSMPSLPTNMERSYSPTPPPVTPSQIHKLGMKESKRHLEDYTMKRFVGLAYSRKTSNLRRRGVHCAFCLNLMKLEQLPIPKLLQIETDEVSIHI